MQHACLIEHQTIHDIPYYRTLIPCLYTLSFTDCWAMWSRLRGERLCVLGQGRWMEGETTPLLARETSLSTYVALAPSDREKLTTFLVTRGVTSVNPDNILAIAKSGSHMYGLATPTSDTNYIIVFREPTEVYKLVQYTMIGEILTHYRFPPPQSIISSYRPRKVSCSTNQ